jgi:hypothetical protein
MYCDYFMTCVSCNSGCFVLKCMVECMGGFCNMWVCVCVGVCSAGGCMCGFCNACGCCMLFHGAVYCLIVLL